MQGVPEKNDPFDFERKYSTLFISGISFSEKSVYNVCKFIAFIIVLLFSGVNVFYLLKTQKKSLHFVVVKIVNSNNYFSCMDERNACFYPD